MENKLTILQSVTSFAIGHHYPNLMIDDAAPRIASVVGFSQSLTAFLPEEDPLHQYGVRLLNELHLALDHLNTFGGNHEGTETPRFLFRLTDDGTLHNFGFLAYRYVHDKGEFDSLMKQEPRRGLPSQYYYFKYRNGDGRYYADFNGGLIYHGPAKAGNDFTVTLNPRNPADPDTRWWGMHT
jgi:hypothetical protein